ncbi:MAG: response regulator, partial [Ignavibacteria bacterium]
MKTKKVLLISTEKDLIEIIKISALTLTKLNCQVSFDDTVDEKLIIEITSAENLDLIIVDLDEKTLDPISTIGKIRSYPGSVSKKIISVYFNEVNKDKVYEAGCDSIMSKDELKKVV